jgi:hypothetical protein
MKVLLVNFNQITGDTRGSHSSMQSLFREAEIHNAVLFFDECESMFAQRGHGGSSHMTMLLTEIGKLTSYIIPLQACGEKLVEAWVCGCGCVGAWVCVEARQTVRGVHRARRALTLLCAIFTCSS